MGVKRPTLRGQASVEYMLLLCTVTCVVLLTGTFLSKFGTSLVDDIGTKLLEAAITLAMP